MCVRVREAELSREYCNHDSTTTAHDRTSAEKELARNMPILCPPAFQFPASVFHWQMYTKTAVKETRLMAPAKVRIWAYNVKED